MFNIFRPVRVTRPIYEQFINTGRISENILRLISLKVIKAENLNEMELAIFHGKTQEINELIVQISNKED